MSVTIGSGKIKFTIYGQGHERTRRDSGSGEGAMFFSHPFVPKGSVNYAGQYLFYVLDENGDPLDAVKDDFAHCTFTPALGTAFNTEGEVGVQVSYHREYIHDDETIIIDKTLTQKITVVDHGNVVKSAGDYWGVYYCSDIYSDGYCFLRPRNVNDLTYVNYCQPWADDGIVKVSSIYWRTESLGSHAYFLRSANLSDLSELSYADVSNVTRIRGLVYYNMASDIDLSPLATWDTSNVTDMSELLGYCSKITSLRGLNTWNVSKVTNFSTAFLGMTSLSDITALNGWNVSSAVNMTSMFQSCGSISSLEPLANWNPKNVTSMNSMFRACSGVTSLQGLENWNVSALKDIRYIVYGTGITSLQPLANWSPALDYVAYAFASIGITTLEGLERFNVSAVSDFSGMFSSCNKLLSAEGLETWNTQSATSFAEMFGYDPWLGDISALENWNTSNVTDMSGMFINQASILDISPLDDWDFSNASMSNMFKGFAKYHSDALGKDVWANAYYYFDYAGNEYVSAEVNPVTEYTKDALSAGTWNVSGTGQGAFDSHWINIPSWN